MCYLGFQAQRRESVWITHPTRTVVDECVFSSCRTKHAAKSRWRNRSSTLSDCKAQTTLDEFSPRTEKQDLLRCDKGELTFDRFSGIPRHLQQKPKLPTYTYTACADTIVNVYSASKCTRQVPTHKKQVKNSTR